ncbi:type II toxin-antitoxin system HicB family antitoxin [Kiloniella sp.]|uniref:type II toxin-antitoxin system HicB family antitoxin n=1 Tax=Kiloniella sp. TaxID=1938587 RepID=UPI003A8DC053
MTQKRYYPALIDKQPGSDYGVTFPDFPGCVSAGKDIPEAFEMAKLALSGHITVMNDDGDQIPEPSDIESIDDEDKKYSLLVTLVEVTMPGKPKRVNVMLDEGLLSRIDAVSKNRSAFLAEAAQEKLRAV